MPCSDLRCSTGRDAYRRIADLPVCTVLQTDFRALEGAEMNIFLSILGTTIVTILIAGAYYIGVSVGRAAAGYEDDDREPVIYMEHMHGCAVIRKALRLLGGEAGACL
jgi:hypothetical protein